jgi:hypothetical protein
VVTLAHVAAALDRPVEALRELDRRPLRLAFLGGTYETVVVRDRVTGATLEATLEAVNGESVDPVELRRRDRELAERHGAVLDPPLLDLLLRHPELEAIRVLVTRERMADAVPLRAAAREVAALARDPDVTRIELAEEPEILD